LAKRILYLLAAARPADGGDVWCGIDLFWFNIIRRNFFMSDLVLEHLRHIRGAVDRLGERMDDLTARMSAVEHQLAGVHAELAGVHGEIAGLNKRIDRVEQRLERIDKRLDLAET
jgi:septal ring factor EnvC (AmiA/AmiB activator)